MSVDTAQAQPNHAIVVHDDGTISAEILTTPYVPTGSQTLVRVEYSALNPADIRHAYMGMYKTSSVAGYEWAGTAIGVGEQSPYKVGQRLFGMSRPDFNGAPRPTSSGAHQDFLLAETPMTRKLPEGLEPNEAVALPTGLQTASDALFNLLGYGFQPAGLSGISAKDVPLLIWGGASTCGVAAIQVAKVAGFSPIFATASSKNHEALKRLGADECFDYRDANVIENIKAAVTKSGKKLSTVFDGVGAGLGVFEPPPPVPLDPAKSTPSLARKCLSDVPDKDLKLCAVLPVAHDPAWTFCLGIRDAGNESLGIPQDPSWPERVETFMEWFLKNPSAFRMPNVTIVKGIDEGMRQIQRVFEGKASMEKVVIARPLA